MDKLNSRHFIFIIMGTSIVTLKTYPTLILKYGERDSWIAIMIASIILFLYIIYILWICKKTNCYNIYKIYTYSLGKILGTIFLLLFILTLFLTLIQSASIQGSSMHVNLLIDTPPWFLIMFFIIIGLYSIKKGLNSIIIITIIGISSIMIAGINLSIMTQKYKKAKYLFPILANGLDRNFLIAVLISLGCYGSLASSFTYLPQIQDKKNLTKNSIIALLIVIQMEIIAMIGTITSFGVKRAVNIFYPKLVQTQLVSYFGFLESGEFFVMFQIIGGWFMQYILNFYAILQLLKHMKITNKYIPYILSLLVFIGAYLASKNIFTLFNLLDYYVFISLINFILIPLIIFTIFLIKFNIKTHEKNTGK